MENNHKHISQDEFKSYLAGKMTAQEKVAFEQFVENDPFAKEALDGFLLLENNAKAIELINNEATLLANKTGFDAPQSNKKIPLFRIVALAASLIFVVGGVFFTYQFLQNNNQIAEANNEFIEEQNLEENRRRRINSDLSINESAMEEDALEMPSAFEINKKETVKQEVLDVDYKKNEAPKTISKEETSVPIADSFFELNDKKTTHESAGSPNVVSKEAQRATALQSEVNNSEPVTSAINFSKGYEKFQEGSFNEAISFFNEAIKNQEKVIESNYYVGMSYYYQKKYTKAIKSYDTVLNMGSNSLTNNTKWYKANALIEAGKKSEAKVILTELVETNSSFKGLASDLLNSL